MLAVSVIWLAATALILAFFLAPVVIVVVGVVLATRYSRRVNRNARPRSDDGNWEWDGSKWVAVRRSDSG